MEYEEKNSDRYILAFSKQSQGNIRMDNIDIVIHIQCLFYKRNIYIHTVISLYR